MQLPQVERKEKVKKSLYEKSMQEKSISNKEKVKQLNYLLFLQDTVKIQDLQ